MITKVVSPTVLNEIKSSSERLIIVDALRGFALFGILVAHITLWFDGGPLPEYIYQKYMNDIPSGIVLIFLEVFFRGKFFSIFSFLFGISFAIQLINASNRKEAFVGKFIWRMAILGLIGFIHHLHWRGDILSIYAILGCALLLCKNLPDKWLFTLAFVLLLNIPVRLTELYYAFYAIKPVEMFDNKKVELFFQIISEGNYYKMLWANLLEFQTKMNFQILSGRIYITFGFFLLGLYAGRKNLFGDSNQNRRFFQKIFKYSGLAVLGIFASFITIGLLSGAFQGKAIHWSIQILGGLHFDAFNLCLSLFYIATITLLLQKQKFHSILSALAPIGKMALSNYLFQSLIGLILFYGVGFLMIGKISPSICFLMAIPVFALEIWLSKLWLHYFQYGLLEWLWRSGTDLQWRSLRKIK